MNPVRFSSIPVWSGHFCPISGVNRFGPVGAHRFGPILWVGRFGPTLEMSRFGLVYLF